MSFLNVTLGEIVYSKAGRDCGRKFVITGFAETHYVYISDGDLRRIEKPKKKKIKHLELTGIVIDSLSEKLTSKVKVTNSEIRKALSAYENKPGGSNVEPNNSGF